MNISMVVSVVDRKSFMFESHSAPVAWRCNAAPEFGVRSSKAGYHFGTFLKKLCCLAEEFIKK